MAVKCSGPADCVSLLALSNIKEISSHLLLPNCKSTSPQTPRHKLLQSWHTIAFQKECVHINSVTPSILPLQGTDCNHLISSYSTSNAAKLFNKKKKTPKDFRLNSIRTHMQHNRPLTMYLKNFQSHQLTTNKQYCYRPTEVVTSLHTDRCAIATKSLLQAQEAFQIICPLVSTRLLLF